MIEAVKSRWFDTVFFHYNKHCLLRRHFHSIGLQGSLDPQEQQGILYVMNHSSWWDGLIAYHLFRTCSRGDHYVMMDEKQMRQYRFFRKLGAFSIDKSSSRGLTQSLKYAVSLLDAGKQVWIYPQGDIQHLEKQPLVFQNGIGFLLERSPKTAVIPVTIYYTMGHYQKAEVTLAAGEPIRYPWNELGRAEAVRLISDHFNVQLLRHKELVVSGTAAGSDFAQLLRPGRSTSDRFDAVKKRVDAWKSFFGSS
ncbi:lysophospholipid acyltransferase family protein [Paenibacillus abyssi]|uniref:Glycerol acyltransferase n=1 Tax=Paenibacillus abyssi TaxID=1340531 RepID=A0A917LFY3_9BACL|nr:lysophospholipid acyltransferase family protein [Paenibacillus abyssi]GGG20742.1 glycerol acyltransferase [Paenibacillus abyssi]